MGLFDRFKRSRRSRESATSGDRAHLADWTSSRIGVEAFVEPKTTVTPVTVVLVANDGEWTRRAVGGDKGARKLGEDLKIPVYDVRKVGYPQRMRDHDARQKILRRRAQQEE
ncbi:MAG: oxidoreductase [Rhodococcus sp. (in: high G+C Gram-positive bacteria)]